MGLPVVGVGLSVGVGRTDGLPVGWSVGLPGVGFAVGVGSSDGLPVSFGSPISATQ